MENGLPLFPYSSVGGSLNGNEVEWMRGFVIVKGSCAFHGASLLFLG